MPHNWIRAVAALLLQVGNCDSTGACGPTSLQEDGASLSCMVKLCLKNVSEKQKPLGEVKWCISLIPLYLEGEVEGQSALHSKL